MKNEKLNLQNKMIILRLFQANKLQDWKKSTILNHKKN